MNKVKEIDPTIDCRDCSALCCGKGQTPTLTDSEVAFLIKGGTSLNQKGIPKFWRRFYFEDPKGVGGKGFAGIFNFAESCGYIAEKDGWLQCGMYNDPRRPDECKWFEMGGEGCQTIIAAGSIEACIKNSRGSIFNRFKKALIGDIR